MELRQLQYFAVVVQEANFTKAAAKLHVAQPGVSAQIRKLEHELGQTLLDRSGRTVRLTTAGAAVLPCVRAALEAIADARVVVDELTGLVRGHVAMGMVVSCPSIDVPNLLAEFHNNHPAVEITLSEANSDRLIEALRDGELDVAVVGVAGAPPTGIETQLITDEPLVAAVSPSDPLATRTTITLQTLQERALISLPRGTGLRTCIDDAFVSVSIKPRVAFEASNLNVLAQLAIRGLGVAILPESVAKTHSRELHAISVTRPQLRSRLELAWRAEGPTSPAAKALIKQARTALATRR